MMAAMDKVHKNTGEKNEKVDPITELQGGIDGLSLAMFEALRGLRDAVAPESGNLGGSNSALNITNENSDQPDFEEFWHRYRNGDEEAVAQVKKASNGMPPKKREDFIRIHGRIEMEKDAELVTQLASTVLEKSDEINERVSSLPGMHRTKKEQMKYIEELLEKNRKAAAEVEARYTSARARRDQVRKFIRTNTCTALEVKDGD